MKILVCGFLLFCINTTCFSQVYDYGQSAFWASNIENSKDATYVTGRVKQINTFDFSTIWLDEDCTIIGIIGENFQRLDIKLLSITKDFSNPNVYYVYGKSKVKNNVCEFQGSITIIKTYRQTQNSHSEYLQEGYVIANYAFYEKSNQSHSGYFKGVLKTFYAINKNNTLVYPHDADDPDSNYNNGFVGTWTHYKTKKSKIANWGSDFVPLSGDLNVAVAIGDFIPNEKYHQYGWDATEYGWKSPSPTDWWK